MRYYTEGSTIRARTEGVFFCLDAEALNDRCRSFHEELSSSAEREAIPFRTGMLSWPCELEGFPEPSFLDEMKMASRGRFITPLFEEIFPRLEEREYHLIIACERWPTDWDDWVKEASRTFMSVSRVAPSSMEDKLSEIKKRVQEIVFGKRLPKLEISCREGIIHKWPEGFKLHVGEGAMRLVKETPLLGDGIYVGIQASGEEVAVLVNGEQELRVRTENAMPVAFDRALSEKESKWFTDTLTQISEGAEKLPCMVCNTKHEFRRPFYCERMRKRGRVFSCGAFIFEDVETIRADADYAVFQVVDGALKWSPASGRVICLDGVNFFANDDAGKSYLLNLRESTLDIRELEEISPGLVSIGYGTYVLSLFPG